MNVAQTPLRIANWTRRQSEIRNPKSSIRNPLGFTLVELLFVIAIFSGIMGALLLTFVAGRSSYLSADAAIQVQQEARRAFDAMVKELREAGGTVVATAGPPAQLEFQIALGFNLTLGGCVVNTVCWGARDQNGVDQPGWRLRYRVNGTQLIREILNPNASVQPGTRVLANAVNNGLAVDGQPATSFSYDGTNRIVAIRLEIVQTSPQLAGGRMATSPPGIAPLSTQVKLRNRG